MSRHSFIFVQRNSNGRARVVKPLNVSRAQNSQSNRTESGSTRFNWLVVIFVLAITVGGYMWHNRVVDGMRADFAVRRADLEQDRDDVQKKLVKLLSPPIIKKFDNKAFPALFDNKKLAYVSDEIQKPTITGDEAVDAHIRTIAEARGYKLRPEAKKDLLALIDGRQVQLDAAVAWLQLRTTAQREGVQLGLTSAFRSFEDQRQLFLARSGINSYTDADILNGGADAVIGKVLEEASPPGYSKHHTGYTVDIEDAANPGAVFKTTAAFNWLSQNNYANAKKFGWIPSYPEGGPDQGPKPESWEFIWVGVPALAE